MLSKAIGDGLETVMFLVAADTAWRIHLMNPKQLISHS